MFETTARVIENQAETYMLDEIISRQVPKLNESGPLAVGGPSPPQGPDAALLRHGEEGLPRIPVLVG